MTKILSTPVQLACALAIGTAAGSAAAATRYDCQVLDTVGYTYAWPAAINTAGETAGFGDFASSRNAARWSVDGKATELDDIGAYGSAGDINDNGLVVGRSYDAQYSQLPIAWAETTPAILPLPPAFAEGSANGVNNHGTIVGEGAPQGSVLTHAVLWRNGAVHDLGTLDDGLPTLKSSARAINNHGVIVGFSQFGLTGSDHAVWWDRDRRIHDLGTLPGGQQSRAMDVNDRGVVVGYSEHAAGSKTVHAVAWVDGVARDLGVMKGRKESHAYAVNQSGTVVGSGPDGGGGFPFDVALVWPHIDQAPRDLNRLLTPACGANLGPVQLTDASDINSDGVIAATGQYADALGNVHYVPYKLTPVKVESAGGAAGKSQETASDAGYPVTGL